MALILCILSSTNHLCYQRSLLRRWIHSRSCMRLPRHDRRLKAERLDLHERGASLLLTPIPNKTQKTDLSSSLLFPIIIGALRRPLAHILRLSSPRQTPLPPYTPQNHARRPPFPTPGSTPSRHCRPTSSRRDRGGPGRSSEGSRVQSQLGQEWGVGVD